jgi:putative hydrolase of the HAD superfamily
MNAVLFDLDNTLYDVEQYFLGAFRTISESLSKKYGFPRQNIYKKLVEIWNEKTSMYPHLFNDLLSFLKIDEKEVQNLLKLFNRHDGKIEPYPDTVTTLNALREKGCKLGLITDGNPERQKNKIKLLNIQHFFNIIVYTKEIEPKPSSISYLTALEKLGVEPSNVFYVADNPLIDFEGAKKAGIQTIRILRGEFAKLPKNMYIDFEIKSLCEIIKIVKR